MGGSGMRSELPVPQRKGALARAALRVAQWLVYPPFFAAILILLPFAWALDWIEARLYGEPRTASVNRGY